jgi:hypothetical protein
MCSGSGLGMRILVMRLGIRLVLRRRLYRNREMRTGAKR